MRTIEEIQKEVEASAARIAKDVEASSARIAKDVEASSARIAKDIDERVARAEAKDRAIASFKEAFGVGGAPPAMQEAEVYETEPNPVQELWKPDPKNFQMSGVAEVSELVTELGLGELQPETPPEPPLVPLVVLPSQTPTSRGSVPSAADLEMRHQGLRTVEVEVKKDYASTTIGFEQEITSRKVFVDKKDRGVIGTVSKDGVDLVDFMTDMGDDELGQYTMELRSTPCEKNDQEKIALRKAAMAVMVSAIGAAAPADVNAVKRPVAPQEKDGFKIQIRVQHRIGAGDATLFANQVSMGVSTESLASAGGEAALVLENAKWFDSKRSERLGTEGLKEPEKAAQLYGMLASTIAFLAAVLRKEPNRALGADGSIALNIFDPPIKDSWDALPRTPPMEWLECLSEDDRRAVLAQIRKDFVAEGVALEDKGPDKFDSAALKYIANKEDLAGHKVAPPTIEGKHSSVFEFRKVPDQLDEYLFSKPVATPQAPSSPDPLKELAHSAILKRRMPAPDAQESDSDSDDD